MAIRFIKECREQEKKKMKLSEFISKYGDCEVTEEMEKFIKKPKGKWRPKDGDIYWYINQYGNITNNGTCGTYPTCEYQLSFMRLFKTYGEAVRYLEIMKACKEASFEPDWEDSSQTKYYFSYNYRDYHTIIDRCCKFDYGSQFYFESFEKARDLINKFGEKNIAKYVLGIEVE